MSFGVEAYEIQNVLCIVESFAESQPVSEAVRDVWKIDVIDFIVFVTVYYRRR